MTFMTKLERKGDGGGSVPDFSLTQRGRSGLQILGSIQRYSAGSLRKVAADTFAENEEAKALSAEHEADKNPDKKALRQRIARAREICESDPNYRMERFLQRYVAEENFNRGIPAIEERREQFEKFVTEKVEPVEGSELTMAAEPPAPKYWTDVDWHLEPGGWDGYDLYGPLFAFGLGPLIFKFGGYAAVGYGDDIIEQRMSAIRQFPKESYERIYEPGCGGVSTLGAINKVFPGAELYGSDLSPLLLKNGYMLANKMNFPVHLKHEDSTQTSEPDNSVDGVITYALHHEMPPKANKELFKEMFRIMKPGADIVLSDPPPFRAVSLFHSVILDWDTDHRAEPFFSTILESSLEEMMEEAGFEAVEAYSIGQDGYPWITRARKPAETTEQGVAA
ncbi:class I SAM-dependent methyltransferase [Ponticaulis sp.]|uniref:class I SAM-dependent methyltransferase n=1 Tax=Ponticaulis sp. TaxID=2020902 RepID=UPI00262EA30E|nr:class I SAM-dependent methyltransferase [Ponticaulis sp.]MDF1679038.1 class I SAM-dependent methyltransferase [Ponticaulis sp.]